MNVLFLYNATQTHTNTVFEHLAAFSAFSRMRAFFMHVDARSSDFADLSRFDAICVHYSVRLPYDELSPVVVEALQKFSGLKFLFIQDEYDKTHRAWYWIQTVGIQLVFTVVPDQGIKRVYPPEVFPNTRFVTNLTGYAPSFLHNTTPYVPPSRRSLTIGYRGRPLPPRYGKLGFEKVEIGRMVREYCEQRGIEHDIAWTEEARIYGPAWTSFVSSCRAMLGSESGSNVFDWDGQLASKVDAFTRANPGASDVDTYDALVRQHEMDGLMNQISPRVFEAISARTVLVLFEGAYSDIIEPFYHFIPLKKDGSNLTDVFEKLADRDYVDSMADRAFDYVIASGKFGYPAFVEMVDYEVASLCVQRSSSIQRCGSVSQGNPVTITTMPIRAIPLGSGNPSPTKNWVWQDGELKFSLPLSQIWSCIPEPIRLPFRTVARRIRLKLESAGQ